VGCSGVLQSRTLTFMRSVRLVLLSLLLAVSACGDDVDGPTACEVGPDILKNAVALVEQDQPACTRDDECVLVALDVECDGFSASSCGTIVHRVAAARWDAAKVCHDIDRASVPSKFGCAFDASCAGPAGPPVCRAGRCTDPELP